jgi:hypothetical protein
MRTEDGRMILGLVGQDRFRGGFEGVLIISAPSDEEAMYEWSADFEDGEWLYLRGVARRVPDAFENPSLTCFVDDESDDSFSVTVDSEERTASGHYAAEQESCTFVSRPLERDELLALQQADDDAADDDDDDDDDDDEPEDEGASLAPPPPKKKSKYEKWPSGKVPPPKYPTNPPFQPPTRQNPIVEVEPIPGIKWKMVLCGHKWRVFAFRTTVQDTISGVAPHRIEAGKKKMRERLKSKLAEELARIVAVKSSDYVCMPPCKQKRRSFKMSTLAPQISAQRELLTLNPQFPKYQIVGALVGSAAAWLECKRGG